MEEETMKFCCICKNCLIGKRRILTSYLGKCTFYCLYGIEKEEKPFEEKKERWVKKFGCCEHFEDKFSGPYCDL